MNPEKVALLRAQLEAEMGHRLETEKSAVPGWLEPETILDRDFRAICAALCGHFTSVVVRRGGRVGGCNGRN